MAGNSAQVTFAFLAKDAASKTIRGLSKTLGGLKKTASTVGGALRASLKIGAVAIGAIAAAATPLVYAVKQASDFNETLNKTRVVLGEASDAVIAFADTAASKIGLSKTEALNAASTFAIFGKSANLSGEDLAGFSTQLTTLAADFGSFYNASNEEAITAIGAALRGESEPIRRFGILLNDATLKERAFAMGLIKTTKGALTPQNKVLAAQAEILAQAQKTGSFGDFAATLGGSLPNQIKVLQANFSSLTTDLGKEFLPVAFQVVDWANKEILPAIKKVLPTIIEFAQGAIKTAGALANKLAPTFRTIANFIFNKVVPAIRGFIDNLVKPGGVADSIGQVVGPILDKLVPAFGAIFDAAVRIVGKIGELAAALWDNGNGPLAVAVKLLGAAFEIFFGILGKILGVIEAIIDAAIDAVNWLKKMFDAQRAGENDKYLRMGGINPVSLGGTTPTPTPTGTGSVAPGFNQYYNVYVGAKSVAEAVVPVLARDVTRTPRGGR